MVLNTDDLDVFMCYLMELQMVQTAVLIPLSKHCKDETTNCITLFKSTKPEIKDMKTITTNLR